MNTIIQTNTNKGKVIIDLELGVEDSLITIIEKDGTYYADIKCKYIPEGEEMLTVILKTFAKYSMQRKESLMEIASKGDPLPPTQGEGGKE